MMLYRPSSARRAAACLALLCGGAAHAQDAFDFSYAGSRGVLSGRLEGTLQADGDTIVVSAIDFASFGGNLGPALPFVSSALAWKFGGSESPIVSIGGTHMDIGTCSYLTTTTDCAGGQGFIFDTTGWLSQAFDNGLGNPPRPFLNFSPAFGDMVEPFYAKNWSIAAVSAVPEPSTYALMLAGLGALAIAARRGRPAQRRAPTIYPAA
jgi:hypothetical protein